MASLILLKTPDGSTRGDRYQIGNIPLVIGRSPDECQIVLPTNTVSRKHAQITLSQNNFFIEDLGSHNKTFVNNREIAERTQLKDGDGIKICDFMFSFRDETKIRHTSKEEPKFVAELEEIESGTTTVEATYQRVANQFQFLEAQPSEKLRSILNISNALSKTLDVRALFPRIAEELMNLFRQADRCFLIEYDETERKLIPVHVKTRRSIPGTNERFSGTIVRKCIESLQSFLSEDASSDQAVGFAQSIADFRIRSVMCVPIVSQDSKALGVIQVDSQDRTKKFTKEDLQFLICVANQAGIAIENARMHSALLLQHKFAEENKAASKVQRGFLPQKLPDVEGYEFFTHYESARNVGGDYYDFIQLSNSRLAVLLGDVSGKGVPAALLMARVSGEAKICMLTQPDVASAITQLNDQLLQTNLEDRYITLAATVLDPIHHAVTIVNAGHIPPAIYRSELRRLEFCVPEEVGGFPVGWVPGFVYDSITVQLNPGDTLILFTDGIHDAESTTGERFGEEGVEKVMQKLKLEPTPSCRKIGDELVYAVQQHAMNHPQFDDIALVCLGRRGSDWSQPPTVVQEPA